MCRPFSAIIRHDGVVLRHPDTDAHEDIREFYGLTDDGLGRFAPVEYRTGSGIPSVNIKDYALRMDDGLERPSWLTDEKWRAAETELRRVAASAIIVEGHRRLLLGGPWIIGGDARVDSIGRARVLFIYGSAQVESIYGSAQVESICDSAQVKFIYDSAQVESICDSAQVKFIYDSAQVKSICDSAQVESICGSAQVESIYGSAQVKSICDSAQVKFICGSAQVESIYGSAQVKFICDSAQVKSIYDSARIVHDERNADSVKGG